MNLAEISIKRPALITSLVTLMFIAGWINLRKMPVDLFPDVTFPVVVLQVVYPGASPEDMEKLVSKPLEDELGSLSGLDKIQSSNSESFCFIVMQFKMGTDIKDSEQQVRQRLSNVRRLLPKEIEEPVVRRFDPADQPVFQIALISELPPADIYDIAYNLVKPRFETLPGVGQVSISGGTKKEVQVSVDQKKLQERKLSLLQIAEKIRSTSQDVPLGKIDTGKSETVLRATGEFSSLKDLENVSVSFFGSDRSVLLKEVATVEEGVAEQDTSSRIRVKSEEWLPQSSVFLSIFKQSGENTIAVVDAAQKQLPLINSLLKEKSLKAQLTVVRDGAWPIRANVSDVTESILIGIFLCVVVVFFFLGSGKSTVITALAIPNSLFGGFILMNLMGFSINVLSLLALSLAVGLLIDDAIVVRENIFRHKEMGKSALKAALEGTQEVTMAVIATTLVVIAVFGPIGFLHGIVGQFFKQFGLTVVFTMIISTFDAFTVAPMLSAYWGAHHEEVKKNFLYKMVKAFDRFQTELEVVYVKILRWVLAYKGVVVSLGIGSFFLSLLLVGWIPKTFMPTPDNGEFIITLELPTGSSLTVTDTFSKKIEEVLTQDPAVEFISSTLGILGSQRGGNLGSLYIKLLPKKERPQAVSTSQVKERIRSNLEPFQKEGTLLIGDFNPVGTTDKIVNLHLKGEDLVILSEYAEKLKARASKISGFTDVDVNYRSGKPEYHIVFHRVQAESLGVSTVTAGAELRARVEGVVPAQYRLGDSEYDIRVRLKNSQRDIRQNLNEVKIPNANFNMIPLSKVASGQQTQGFSQINRLNKSRFISLSGNIGSQGALAQIVEDLEKVIQQEPEYALPLGVTYRFEGQAQDMKDLFENMLLAMGLGIILVYLVLASLYESYITPLTILLALPLAVSGALVALFIFQKSLDIFSMIGFVMLLGVVAKNSILLVDYAQQLIYSGTEREKALIESGRVRLRPILMTSFALIAGILPIAIGLNEASSQRTSMGVAIIGGLISSTGLSLIVVPAAFGYIDDFRLWCRKLFRLS
jgi:hydrophobic/amphiphilic exporter-1 (mainly G- bacteria), HAE1 family